MKQFYTYLHCKPDGIPFYVGKGYGNRSHNLINSRNPHHKNIVAKYGKENILVYVFECESEEQAFVDEITQIAHLKCEGFELVNMTDGGEGASGTNVTLETRNKMSIKSKLKWQDQEFKKRQSEAHKGKVSSQETCNKISAIKKAKNFKHSEETKLKISTSLTGKKLSEETCKKLSIARKGKNKSTEWCEKISLAKKGKTFTDEHKENLKNNHWTKRQNIEEIRKKISLTHTGKILSQEHKNAIGLSSAGMKHSEESKNKMRDAWVLRKLNKENNHD